MAEKIKSEVSIEDLEKALLERADALSKEYSERAKRSYNHYIEDENKRLRLREEREEMAAKMQAEQVYRRMVQTEELKSIKRLDQLRWKLMHKVIDDVKRELLALTGRQDDYLSLIKKGIKELSSLIPENNLVLEFNSEDHLWLEPQWQSIVNELKLDKSLVLSEKLISCIGGFIMYDQAHKIRINNTFEGLVEQYAEDVNQIVAENLFAELTPIRSNINER